MEPARSRREHEWQRELIGQRCHWGGESAVAANGTCATFWWQRRWRHCTASKQAAAAATSAARKRESSRRLRAKTSQASGFCGSETQWLPNEADGLKRAVVGLPDSVFRKLQSISWITDSQRARLRKKKKQTFLLQFICFVFVFVYWCLL